MAAYRWVYNSRHLQADYQEQGSAPEPYAWQSSMGYLYLWLRLSDKVLVWLSVWSEVQIVCIWSS